MGENEQGGMLRTVVVVGLVAIIAAVVMFAVTGLKGNMTKNTSTAIYQVEKTPSPYTFFKNGNISFDSYQVEPWNGFSYQIPVKSNIKPDYWREVHMQLTPVQDSTVQVDINNYDLDNPSATTDINDNDVVSERVVSLYEGTTLVQNMWNGKGVGNMKAGHTYQLLIKYHNGTDRTLYDVNRSAPNGSNGMSRLVLGTPDGSAGRVKVHDVEAATYKMP